MNKQHFTKILALLVAATCLGGTAQAETVLQFSNDSGTTFANAFTVDTGETATVQIFLTETAADTQLVNDGLIGFGLDLVHSEGLGNISSADPNSFFDLENHDVRSANGFQWEYFESNSTGLRASTVLIGTLDFATTGEGTTTFTVSDRLVGSGFTNASWLTSTVSALDEEIFGSGASETFGFSISTTAVPEPSSIILLCATSIGFLAIRRRK